MVALASKQDDIEPGPDGMKLCRKCQDAIHELGTSPVHRGMLFTHDAESLDDSVAQRCFVCANLWRRLDDGQRKAMCDPEAADRTVKLEAACSSASCDGLPWTLNFWWGPGYYFIGSLANFNFMKTKGIKDPLVFKSTTLSRFADLNALRHQRQLLRHYRHTLTMILAGRRLNFGSEAVRRTTRGAVPLSRRILGSRPGWSMSEDEEER